MTYNHQVNFVSNLKEKHPEFFEDKSVLEVGSLNINGSIRNFFERCLYVGIDVRSGDCVDVVCNGKNYRAPNETYDVICSLGSFEYNPDWIETFKNMIRMCVPGGLVFFTCSTENTSDQEHIKKTLENIPLETEDVWDDYYKNLTENDFYNHIKFEDHFDDFYFNIDDESKNLVFYGFKKGKIKIKVKENKSIPMIGIPIVNGFHWVQRLIDSIDYPTDKVFIFDNNGRGELTEDLDNLAKKPHPFIKEIKVCHLPANIGVAGSWNMIIKCAMKCPYWIISSHDVAFTPGFLENFISKADDKDVGIVHGGNRGAWDIFLLKDWVVQECGLFDENFYPGYVEDCDYFIRTMLKGVKRANADLHYLHGEKDYETTGSQTWREDPSLKDKLYHSRYVNEVSYMYSKWGPEWHKGIDWVDTNPYKYPFNNKELPLNYTTYDLNFVRGKHLGF